tara:strand:+ start:6055 stop:6591 length:537 start_codon:yes stop_codon:yes gene_type:complete
MRIFSNYLYATQSNQSFTQLPSISWNFRDSFKPSNGVSVEFFVHNAQQSKCADMTAADFQISSDDSASIALGASLNFCTIKVRYTGSTTIINDISGIPTSPNSGAVIQLAQDVTIDVNNSNPHLDFLKTKLILDNKATLGANTLFYFDGTIWDDLVVFESSETPNYFNKIASTMGYEA